MNTIYLVSRAKMTGPINQGLNILNGMKINGRVNSILVTIAPEFESNTWLHRYKDAGIEIVQLNQPLWRTFMAVPKLKKILKERDIDVIHSSGFRANFISLLAGRKVKKVITQRCHPNEIVEKFPKVFQPFFSFFYLKMIKRMDAIVACSKSIQKIFADEFSMNVEVVQNGVNTSYFLPSNKSHKEELRVRLGLPIEKKLALVLGSLRDRKNNSMIIDAIKKISNPDVVVVFVGIGPEEQMLKQKAVGCENIIFAGQTKTPLQFLQACDLLVSASLAEGLPNTVLEALSCGLPCILSDIDPHKELIEGTEAGVIFNRNKVESLIACILESEKWDLAEKSKAARHVAESEFSIPSLAEKYEKIYYKCIKQL